MELWAQQLFAVRYEAVHSEIPVTEEHKFLRMILGAIGLKPLNCAVISRVRAVRKWTAIRRGP